MEILCMAELISHVSSVEAENGSTLEALLCDKSAASPLLPEVDCNDLLAV
jgi:hypothetical protein